jgi:hypothetical protein
MQRRQFLAASIAASAVALAGNNAAQTPARDNCEFYQLRRYDLQNGPPLRRTENYFASALIPALMRRGMGPVGAFKLDLGEQTPAYYLLIPSPSLEPLAELDLSLAEDGNFLEAAAPFWNATAESPAARHVESSLLKAFTGWPKITPPPSSGVKGGRKFQLRTYESPSHLDHLRKIEMVNAGEYEIFKNAGLPPVFFGDTLIGPRLPNLMYLLSVDNLGELDAKWAAFLGAPAWKKLTSNPRFNFDQTVNSVGSVIVSSLDCSQV